MAKVLDILELAHFIRNTKDAFTRGYTLALIQTITKAEALAKRNSTQQFKGRWDRKLSGRLLNSIYSGYTMAQGMPQGFVGTKGIPYGAVHEYGHEGIKPIKAKHLWQKLWGGSADKFRRITPTDFVSEMKQEASNFKIFYSKNGNLMAFHVLKLMGKPVKFKLTPLFWLRDVIKMPERPYIRPAIEEAFENFGELASKQIAREMLK